MKSRLLVPELLDSMEASDPRAIRSRRDLRLINAFLGNERWLLRRLRGQPREIRSIVELGAGEGTLCERLHRALPQASVTGLDLAPRPSVLPARIGWVQGDFLQTLEEADADTCVGNLILHHFPEETLGRLGRMLARFRTLLFCEPLRTSPTLAMARLVVPMAGEVTRHDMPASIRAGFRRRELPRLLGLDPNLWRVEETESLRGSLRLKATRR